MTWWGIWDGRQLYSLAPYRISRCEYDNQLLQVSHYSWPWQSKKHLWHGSSICWSYRRRYNVVGDLMRHLRPKTLIFFSILIFVFVEVLIVFLSSLCIVSHPIMTFLQMRHNGRQIASTFFLPAWISYRICIWWHVSTILWWSQLEAWGLLG